MIRFDEPRISNDASQEEVRLAINPSVLQRFCGSGYYYYDDVPMPYQTLLDEERLLLPSQLHSSDVFGELFIRFCARLAKQQAELNSNLQFESFVLTLAWLIAFGVLLAVAGLSDVEEMLLVLPLFPCWGLFPLLLPAGELESWLARTTRGFRGGYPEIQDLVDEMAPLFREQGHHVDYVQDNKRYPPLIYVRFSRSKSEEVPLAEKMLALQRQARAEHIDALITKRQAKRIASDVFLCGIKAKTIWSLRPCISCLAIPLAFYYTIYLANFLTGGALYQGEMQHHMIQPHGQQLATNVIATTSATTGNRPPPKPLPHPPRLDSIGTSVRHYSENTAHLESKKVLLASQT